MKIFSLIYVVSMFLCFLSLICRGMVRENYLTLSDLLGIMILSMIPFFNTGFVLSIPVEIIYQKCRYIVIWRKK